jgi:hypothetical protein
MLFSRLLLTDATKELLGDLNEVTQVAKEQAAQIERLEAQNRSLRAGRKSVRR